MDKNYKLLILLNIFLGVSISVVCTTGLFDLLYLRMQFNLSWFGLIRGSMFFLPALCYFAAAPFLRGTARSREIVQWAYFIRIWIVVLIPVIALCTANPHLLLTGVVIFTSIAFVAAAFANNTLMVLYRQLLPQSDFNRQNAVLTSCINIAATVFSLLAAGALSMAGGFSNRNFYLLFIALTAGTGAFEFLVFRINRKLSIPENQMMSPPRIGLTKSIRQAFDGFRSPAYRQLLLVVASASFFASLLDTYLCVYLYKVQHASAFVVALIGTVAVFAGNLAGIGLGKWCDRIGYLRFFRQGTIAMLALTLLFAFFNSQLWIVAIFMFFVYNGSSGLLAGAMLNLRNAAAAKLAPATGGESHIAAFAMMFMLCSFAGAISAGGLFSQCQRWTDGGTAESFSLYFKIVAVSAALLLLPLFGRGCKLLDAKNG